jgi:hypothetical protein
MDLLMLVTVLNEVVDRVFNLVDVTVGRWGG